MKRGETPTLEDVALAAGVSTATISRCINSPHKVASATRERVQRSIQELGFTPHFGGRALASNHNKTVGAIIPTMANAMFAGGIQACQEVLSKAGYSLLVASHGYDLSDEFRHVQSLVTSGADGLLFVGAQRHPDTQEFLELRQIPHVISWCIDNEALCYAGFDNQQAAADMTRLVLDRGHRRIGMIAGRTHSNDRARNRVAGVRRAVQEYPQSVTLIDVIEADYQLEAGGVALDQLLALSDRPSAIVCGNDVLAVGAMLRAQQQGLRIPEDLSITGFDDIDLARVTRPALTTVAVPQRQMGAEAARLLLGILQNENSGNNQNITLQTELIIRDSLGAPPQILQKPELET